MQKYVYHLHDVCCNHSTLTLEAAVDYAIKHGYKALYWTEHCPISIPCGYQHRRTPFEKMKDLKRRMEEFNKKYKGKLEIHLGYECEFNKNNRWYFERLARDPLCEFMIMGIHFYGDLFKDPWPYDYTINDTHTAKQIKEYLEMNKAGMECGLFSWAPHPEIWLNSYAKWDKHAIAASKQIIQMAIKNNMPLGFDTNFESWENKTEWHYPSPHFWKLVANKPIKVVLEADAHKLEKMTVGWLNKGLAYAKSLGLTKNITEKLPIRWLPKKPLLVLYEDKLEKYISSQMLSTLNKNKVPLVKITSKTNIKNICKKYNVHPVWTLGLIKNTSILAKAKNTSMFIISNHKGCDLSLEEFSHMNYDQFLKSFIKEVK